MRGWLMVIHRLKNTFGQFHTDPDYDDRANFIGDGLLDSSGSRALHDLWRVTANQ